MSEIRPHTRAASAAGRVAVAWGLFAAHPVAAQTPGPAVATAPPLVQIKDDKLLADRLQMITQDPAIAVDDPANRPLAQALMTEGLKQLQVRAYDQALANFLAAYARVPSPKLLPSVAAVLRDMGRIADVANTYQRYLADPANGNERVTEVKELLSQLDEQLTVLVIRVGPRGAEISVDGGPFVEVADALITRVRAGIHAVRLRTGGQITELTVSGVEGETKEVAAPTQVTEPPGTPPRSPATAPPARIDGWLITGTHYGADSATSPARKLHAGSDGHEVAAIVPHHDVVERSDAIDGESTDAGLGYGAIAVARIDGKGRGFAGGFGLAISRGKLTAEIMVLKSAELGGYVGLRYRLRTAAVRPYAAFGVPGFAFNHDELQSFGLTAPTHRLAVGFRVAAGVEWMINDHVSVQADLGYEHFFFLDDRYEADLFVPTLGVMGRL